MTKNKQMDYSQDQEDSGPKPMIFMSSDDFGFSSMELAAVRALPEVTGDYKDNIGNAITRESKADQRTRDMYNAIIPLLDNLLKDAEKNPYIHWPNRTEKIMAFKEKLLSIRDRD